MTVRVHPMSEDVVVTVTEVAPPTGAVSEQIAAVWSEERTRRPELFEGTLLACDRVYDDDGVVFRLEGHFVPYSWYVAARADREIAGVLGLRAVGVCAILECSDGIVLGRRAATTNDGGLLELVPSGAVDADAARAGSVDLRAAVLTEMREELGLEERDLGVGPTPFALVEDDDALLFDCGFRVSTAMSFVDVQRAQAALAHREHDYLQLLTASSADLIGASDFEATSTALLQAARLP